MSQAYVAISQDRGTCSAPYLLQPHIGSSLTWNISGKPHSRLWWLTISQLLVFRVTREFTDSLLCKFYYSFSNESPPMLGSLLLANFLQWKRMVVESGTPWPFTSLTLSSQLNSQSPMAANSTFSLRAVKTLDFMSAEVRTRHLPSVLKNLGTDAIAALWIWLRLAQEDLDAYRQRGGGYRACDLRPYKQASRWVIFPCPIEISPASGIYLNARMGF